MDVGFDTAENEPCSLPSLRTDAPGGADAAGGAAGELRRQEAEFNDKTGAEIARMLEGTETHSAVTTLLIERGSATTSDLMKSTKLGPVLGSERRKRGLEFISPRTVLENLSGVRLGDDRRWFYDWNADKSFPQDIRAEVGAGETGGADLGDGAEGESEDVIDVDAGGGSDEDVDRDAAGVPEAGAAPDGMIKE